MAIELNTKVEVGPVSRGKKLGNLFLFDAKFFGRPNFNGDMDRFKDDRRKFTVLIPNDIADQLRGMGWNVKTLIPTAEDLEQFPDREPLSHLKVMIDDGSAVTIKMGDTMEQLNVGTFGVIDRSNIDEMDMEIRAWEYDPEEKAGQFSARLVSLVANIEYNPLQAKYGRLT